MCHIAIRLNAIIQQSLLDLKGVWKVCHGDEKILHGLILEGWPARRSPSNALHKDLPTHHRPHKGGVPLVKTFKKTLYGGLHFRFAGGLGPGDF